MVRIYMASKMHHGAWWKQLYSNDPDIHIVSRWPFLEEDILPTPENARKFWYDDASDIASAHVVIVYAESEDKLRGALVEAGIAIGIGRQVIAVGCHPDYGTWQYHPFVIRVETLEEAFAKAKELYP